MKLFIATIIIALTFFSCGKVTLDSIAFPREELDSYQFEAFSEGEIEIPESMKLTSADRTTLTFNSIDEESGESYLIYAVYIGDMNTINQDSIILYCHGQSKHMDQYYTRATLLANLGHKHKYGVLMMDYRGYGMSEGTPSEQGLYDDVNVCIDFLKANGADPSRTTYYGYSLGAIPVINIAAYRKDFVPKKIIIESPLASVQYIAQSSTILNMDTDFVSSLEFNNAETMKDVKTELLWIHGKEDTYIAFENGKIIYDNHTGNYKEALTIDNADHSDIPVVMGIENYLAAVELYLNH